MQIHGPSRVQGPQSVNPLHRTVATEASSGASPLAEPDQLDISQEAEMINQVRELPDVREDRVAEIRSQIENGTYDTDGKLDVAVGRLLDEFGG